MSALPRWGCAPPCGKIFTCQRGLSLHRVNNPECLARFEDFVRKLQLRSPHPPDLAQAQDMPSGNIESADETMDISDEVIDGDDGPEEAPADVPVPQSVPSGSIEPSTTYEDSFRGAGRIVALVPPTFTRYRNVIVAEQRSKYYPFQSESDFALAAWLHESGISRVKMDQFLHLPQFDSHPPFKCSADLIKKLSCLTYPGPRWKSQNITPAYGTPGEKVTLFYRDPIEAVRHLFSRPCLGEDMEFTPKKVYSDEEKTTRIYSEMSSADWWWQVQEALPYGATVVPVLIASDSTHLTQFSGGKKAWPVYLSIGNIKFKTRNLPSKRAWLLVGYIPCINFHDDDKIRGTLNARLYHQCMEVITNHLVEPGTHGTHISDSKGDVRHCFTLLAAHIGDLPEQQLSNLALRNASPTTIVTHDNLGSATVHPPRTREWILSCIESVCRVADPNNIKLYQKVAKQHNLNGVHLPFWRNLPHYRPEIAVCPDILHGVIKFWRDHPLLWVRRLMGTTEYDARLKCLQPVPYYRHFKNGIKHLSQWTCREDRELLRTHVATIAGHPNVIRRVMQNQRAIVDFTYLIQYKSHSSTTLQYTTDALQTFHNTKGVYITLGVRRGKKGVIKHYNIPKLLVLETFAPHVILMGVSCQFSTEVAETLHRTLAKEPYAFTNHKNFFSQMCDRLDRSERIAFVREFCQWSAEQDQKAEMETLFHMYTPGYRKMAIDRYQRFLEESNTERPREIRIPVKTRISQARLWLALQPHMPRHEIENIASKYRLHDLERLLRSYLRSRDESAEEEDLAISHIDVWTKLRIRVDDVQDEDGVSQEHCIEALPPSPTQPHGHCHCVLVHDADTAEEVGIEGYRVAQVRLLFQVHLQDTRSPLHRAQLAYVQYFSKPRPTAERDILMYLVSRQDRDGVRKGSIIPMEAISRFVQLIPKFGPKAHVSLASNNSMDICRDYYVNCFADKEIYQSVW